MAGKIIALIFPLFVMLQSIGNVQCGIVKDIIKIRRRNNLLETDLPDELKPSSSESPGGSYSVDQVMNEIVRYNIRNIGKTKSGSLENDFQTSKAELVCVELGKLWGNAALPVERKSEASMSLIDNKFFVKSPRIECTLENENGIIFGVIPVYQWQDFTYFLLTSKTESSLDIIASKMTPLFDRKSPSFKTPLYTVKGVDVDWMARISQDDRSLVSFFSEKLNKAKEEEASLRKPNKEGTSSMETKGKGTLEELFKADSAPPKWRERTKLGELIHRHNQNEDI